MVLVEKRCIIEIGLIQLFVIIHIFWVQFYRLKCSESNQDHKQRKTIMPFLNVQEDASSEICSSIFEMYFKPWTYCNYHLC